MTITRRPLAPALALACLAAPTATARERPAVTGFAFRPATFAVAPPGATATAPARRATIRFRLSARATVTIGFARRRAGRGGRVRFVRVGRLVRRNLPAGRHRIAFGGRVGRRALRRGRYRATITAVDRRQRRSAPRRARFRIARAATTSIRFPNPSTTGVPAGWTPAQTLSTDLTVTQPGAVVQDLLLQNADLHIAAPNVTVRRVKLQGGSLDNWPGGGRCQNGLVIEDSTFEPPPGRADVAESEGAVGIGGYTARRVEISRRSEGFRAGGRSGGCGPVRIEDSFAKIVIPSGRCDLHSDGVQGFDGPPIAIARTTIDFTEAACGTAPVFVPQDQSNTSLTVDGLLVTGGGFPFRMGVPGSVAGLKIVSRSWGYGPIAVVCSLVSAWDARIVTITPDYQVASTVRSQPCNTHDS
jgi:hypothetical protein